MPTQDQIMQFASEQAVLVCNLQNLWELVFPPEVLADIKCLVLRDNYFFNWSARLLQKRIRRAGARGRNKTKII